MKRKFYTLYDDMVATTRGTAAFVDDYVLPDDFFTIHLHQGIKIDHFPAECKLMIETEPLKKMDFDVAVNGMSWIIISKRLAETLKEVLYPNDVELLPILLYDQKGEKVIRDDFYVINALKTFGRSIISSKSVALKSGFILDTILIEKNIPKNVHIFRIKAEQCANKLVVDNVVRKALCSQPHDGLSFIPIETEY